MIANARMYSVTPAVGEWWRRLLGAIADQAGADEARAPLTWVEHPEPLPIGELWRRDDLGAVFMCGLPYSRSVPRPQIVVAPVPSPESFHSQPQYWSELVVRAASGFERLEDTFGHRMAFTAPESQSGYLAALYFLMELGRAAAGNGALYREVIGPRVTPLGAMAAVIDGLADVAPIDSFAFSLLQQYRPELTSQLRIVARTAATPIPPLVASRPVPQSLESAFLEAHKNPCMRAPMTNLQLDRFVRPDPEAYDLLKRRFDAATRFWREHPFASVVHPAFAELAIGPLPV